MNPQFPVLEVTERNDYANYRHMMSMMPILLNAHCIVETGLGNGHSTRIWLESLAQLSKDGKTRYLITYEIEPDENVLHDVQKIAHDLNIDYYCIIGNSVESLKTSRIFVPIDLLYLDSDHSYENVINELNAFESYLSDKAVIMLDDATMDDSYTEVAIAAQKWAQDNGWKSLLFTETRGFPPENIGTNGKMVLVRC